ncbi:MAG: mycofactocin biosynthesis glycosyltransferase MftF [Actinomycetia bacterium]|nr:mycofactocin biosynthesis glycosyltransferase MftF [Actinomycetes bacterium]
MIPVAYWLRESVRIEPAGAGRRRVVSEAPLTVLTINHAAAELLEVTRRGASVADLAAAFDADQERIFLLCERFRRRGILQVRRAPVDAGFSPTVTVIVPTQDRVDDLDDCLQALSRLDHPRDRLEVIVVDDGSTDPSAVADVVARHDARLLTNECNHGAPYSRNRAARVAAGEILAFIDSDCVPGRGWLGELIPYFCWDKVGAVGGRTVNYYTGSRLDRYEEVSSPLDMGKDLIIQARGQSTFYVPTCNLLVRRSTYEDLGGLREDLLVGEDVDFCWRLRANGLYLVYAPEGLVRHKHRDRLGAMLRRRAEYGTSEATLYSLHRDKRKRFPVSPAPAATVGLFSTALLTRKVQLLLPCLLPPLADCVRRGLKLRREAIGAPARAVCVSVARGHLSMVYFVFFHLVRYYLAPLAAAGLFVPGIRLLAATAVLYSGGVDYVTRRPRMTYPVYLAYYVAEHAAYQAGVMAGCVRSRTFRCYLLGRSGTR